MPQKSGAGNHARPACDTNDIPITDNSSGKACTGRGRTEAYRN